MKHVKQKISLGLLFALLGTGGAGGGCAHYYWPATTLDCPETTGVGISESGENIGVLELLAIQSGSDLMATPTQQSKDLLTGVTPDPKLQSSLPDFSVGAMIGIRRNLEVGARFEPFAPPLLRIKYQIVGVPESESQSGNFSLSLGGAGGILLSTYQGGGVTYYLTQASLNGGFRLGVHHIVWLSPSVSMAGLSGAGTYSGSGTRFGAGLGYQWDSESLLFRGEINWTTGSFTQQTSGAQATGLFPGALIGLKL